MVSFLLVVYYFVKNILDEVVIPFYRLSQRESQMGVLLQGFHKVVPAHGEVEFIRIEGGGLGVEHMVHGVHRIHGLIPFSKFYYSHFLLPETFINLATKIGKL
jgi:hypothetical protein